MKKLSLLNYIEIVLVCVIGTILYQFSPVGYMICAIAMTVLLILYVFAVFVYIKIAHIDNPLYSPIMCLYLVCIGISTWLPVVVELFPEV